MIFFLWEIELIKKAEGNVKRGVINLICFLYYWKIMFSMHHKARGESLSDVFVTERIQVQLNKWKKIKIKTQCLAKFHSSPNPLLVELKF